MAKTAGINSESKYCPWLYVNHTNNKKDKHDKNDIDQRGNVDGRLFFDALLGDFTHLSPVVIIRLG